MVVVEEPRNDTWETGTREGRRRSVLLAPSLFFFLF